MHAIKPLAYSRPAARVATLAALLATLAWPLAATAGDRPFAATTSAAAEEDDERVWSIETAARGDRAERGLGVAAEYAFDPLRAVQFELARTRDRLGERTVTEAGVELKWLFNRIARDGWGAGLVGSLSTERASGAAGRTGAWSLVVPVSVQLGQNLALLHLNAGVVREEGERQRLLALGIEGEVWRRVTAFAEFAAQGESRLTHGGVRWWLQREKVALDVSAYRRREDGSAVRGWLLGLGWYDL